MAGKRRKLVSNSGDVASIEVFAGAHVSAAAALFAGQYRGRRAQRPDLPRRCEDPAVVGELLARWQGYAPGVALMQGGMLAGYLLGIALPEFKGTQSGVYCPIWAHAADGADRGETYSAMYAAASGRWLEAGHVAHAVTLYSDDREALDTWFWDGFGLVVVDALRPLAPLTSSTRADVDIRRALPTDVPRLLPLLANLRDHLRRAPVFAADAHATTEAELLAWLRAPAHAFWLAEAEDTIAGFIRCQAASGDVALVVKDPGTISVSGAYVAPFWRGRGIGTALLARLTAWATASGFARCSVDFESQNRVARRFWLRHFAPVCYSVLRRVDERSLSAIAVPACG
jgi:GNAT superfamily N-acetyltransferase